MKRDAEPWDDQLYAALLDALGGDEGDADTAWRAIMPLVDQIVAERDEARARLAAVEAELRRVLWVTEVHLSRHKMWDAEVGLNLRAAIANRPDPSTPPAPTEPDAGEARWFVAEADLARHDAEVGARALEEAAEALDLPGTDATGYYSSYDEAGYREAERDAETWLRDRADRLRSEAGQ